MSDSCMCIGGISTDTSMFNQMLPVKNGSRMNLHLGLPASAKRSTCSDFTHLWVCFRPCLCTHTAKNLTAPPRNSDATCSCSQVACLIASTLLTLYDPARRRQRTSSLRPSNNWTASPQRSGCLWWPWQSTSATAKINRSPLPGRVVVCVLICVLLFVCASVMPAATSCMCANTLM